MIPVLRGRDYLLGTVFVAGVLAFVVFCVGAYNGAFSAHAPVMLKIERSGLVLLPGSDVKIRGLLVGSVDHITSDGTGAEISLDLDPDQLHNVPANVRARLVPKTLFGEKYVSLVPPEDPTSQRLAAGDVIGEDRSKPALEINQVLDDLLPLLRTVQPEQLNATLNALATALDGRGDKLGQTLVDAGAYLAEINPQLPQIQRDLVALADDTGIYDQAAPDLLATLRNLVTTSDTVVAKQATLASFLTEVTGAADSTRGLLATTGDDIIAVNSVNRDLVTTLERYSPVFPCFFRGYAVLENNIHGAVGQTPDTEHLAHIVIELGPPVPGYQYPIDLPEYTDNRGPDCYGLPDPSTPTPKEQFSDGTEDDPRFTGATTTDPTGSAPAISPSAMLGPTAGQQDALDALLAPALGVDANEVPDVSGLLWRPLVSGRQVSLR